MSVAVKSAIIDVSVPASSGIFFVSLRSIRDYFRKKFSIEDLSWDFLLCLVRAMKGPSPAPSGLQSLLFLCNHALAQFRDLLAHPAVGRVLVGAFMPVQVRFQRRHITDR